MQPASNRISHTKHEGIFLAPLAFHRGCELTMNEDLSQSPHCGPLSCRPRVLLLGGTSETAPLAVAMAEAGFAVLVSTASDIPLDVGEHELIRRRTGPLDEAALEKLLVDRDISAVVDAAHPYAEVVHSVAQKVTAKQGVHYFRWRRPEAAHPDASVHMVADHEEAARVACSFGRTVLLTTGSRNIEPYVLASQASGCTLVARVLDDPRSVESARAAGVKEENIVAGRGPFSFEDNVTVIRDFSVGTIVTKDSGEAGGVPAKLRAARSEGCEVVMLKRPQESSPWVFSEIPALVEAVSQALQAKEECGALFEKPAPHPAKTCK